MEVGAKAALRGSLSSNLESYDNANTLRSRRTYRASTLTVRRSVVARPIRPPGSKPPEPERDHGIPPYARDQSARPQRRKYCGSNTRGGTPCAHGAGWRTDHPGYGACANHGGNLPGPSRGAFKAMAQDRMMMAGFTDQIEIDPHDAMMMMIRLKAGEIAYANARIEELEEQGAALIEAREQRTERPLNMGKDGEDPDVTVTEIVRYSQGEYTIWIRLRNEAMRDLVSFSKAAIVAGVAEHLVKREQLMAEQIVSVVSNILTDLKIPLDQKSLPTIQRHLRSLDEAPIDLPAKELSA